MTEKNERERGKMILKSWKEEEEERRLALELQSLEKAKNAAKRKNWSQSSRVKSRRKLELNQSQSSRDNCEQQQHPKQFETLQRRRRKKRRKSQSSYPLSNYFPLSLPTLSLSPNFLFKDKQTVKELSPRSCKSNYPVTSSSSSSSKNCERNKPLGSVMQTHWPLSMTSLQTLFLAFSPPSPLISWLAGSVAVIITTTSTSSFTFSASTFSASSSINSCQSFNPTKHKQSDKHTDGHTQAFCCLPFNTEFTYLLE